MVNVEESLYRKHRDLKIPEVWYECSNTED